MSSPKHRADQRRSDRHRPSQRRAAQHRADQPRVGRARMTTALAGAATVAVAATASLTGTVATAGPASAANYCGRADFADVPRGTAHYNAISWMACEGISVGYGSDNTFRRDRNVTRGEVAAFLYRQVDPRHPESGERYFTDVAPGGAHYDAITWFAQAGISVGYRDRSFRPGQPVTRGELAAFIYRLAGQPTTSDGSFSDMRRSTTHYWAASWLQSEGISAGYTDGSFRPQRAISRGETAAFLKNADDELAGRGHVTTPVLEPLPAEDQASSTVAAWKSKAAQWATQKARSSSTFYRYGGNGPHGYDCSGFTTGAFSAAGKSLPRTSRSQYSAADRHVPLSQARTGDLVYWSNNGKASGIYHVALVVGNGQIAHARNPSTGVTLTAIDYSPANMLGVAGRFS